jgi:hypothetical protein
MIGASLSFCVTDIYFNREVDVVMGYEEKRVGNLKMIRPITKKRIVTFDTTKLVVTSTAALGEGWQELYTQYRNSYWRDDPDAMCEITDRLRVAGKIVQPRLEDESHYHFIGFGRWYDRKELIPDKRYACIELQSELLTL